MFYFSLHKASHNLLTCLDCKYVLRVYIFQVHILFLFLSSHLQINIIY